ncbi:hypothetical protein [Delftia sp. JD2]|uniref:hypothetical protein n=1 Tax=Delftia sp. JD2 TaxID=469553 RepID=UPI0011124F4C|nr:hypothetical protein [Delftia sp. JD2]
MPMTPEVALARKAKKSKESRDFAAAMVFVISLLLLLNVVAYHFLFDYSWAPPARIALLIAGFAGTVYVFLSAFKRLGTKPGHK